MIENKNKSKSKSLTMAAALETAGIQGMSAQAPANTVRYYVLVRNQLDFTRWARMWMPGLGRGAGDVKLQDCKCVCRAEHCHGVSFSSPLNELIVVIGWSKGWRESERDEGFNLISRYCRDKRVNGLAAIQHEL